jgi:hypothetical protein
LRISFGTASALRNLHADDASSSTSASEKKSWNLFRLGTGVENDDLLWYSNYHGITQQLNELLVIVLLAYEQFWLSLPCKNEASPSAVDVVRIAQTCPKSTAEDQKAICGTFHLITDFSGKISLDGPVKDESHLKAVE